MGSAATRHACTGRRARAKPERLAILNDAFALHPTLERDSVPVMDWELASVRLMNDARFPWCLLIPRRPDIQEWHELTSNEQHQLLDESLRLTRLMQAIFSPDKMNVAHIGNLVPQLHVHHVARCKTDPAWPGVVWGYGQTEPYDKTTLNLRIHQLRDAAKY